MCLCLLVDCVYWFTGGLVDCVYWFIVFTGGVVYWLTGLLCTGLLCLLVDCFYRFTAFTGLLLYWWTGLLLYWLTGRRTAHSVPCDVHWRFFLNCISFTNGLIVHLVGVVVVVVVVVVVGPEAQGKELRNQGTKELRN